MVVGFDPLARMLLQIIVRDRNGPGFIRGQRRIAKLMKTCRDRFGLRRHGAVYASADRKQHDQKCEGSSHSLLTPQNGQPVGFERSESTHQAVVLRILSAPKTTRSASPRRPHRSRPRPSSSIQSLVREDEDRFAEDEDEFILSQFPSFLPPKRSGCADRWPAAGQRYAPARCWHSRSTSSGS